MWSVALRRWMFHKRLPSQVSGPGGGRGVSGQSCSCHDISPGFETVRMVNIFSPQGTVGLSRWRLYIHRGEKMDEFRIRKSLTWAELWDLSWIKSRIQEVGVIYLSVAISAQVKKAAFFAFTRNSSMNVEY